MVLQHIAISREDLKNNYARAHKVIMQAILRDCGKETNYTNNVLLREKERSKVANYSRHGLYEIFKLSFLHQRA